MSVVAFDKPAHGTPPPPPPLTEVEVTPVRWREGGRVSSEGGSSRQQRHTTEEDTRGPQEGAQGPNLLGLHGTATREHSGLTQKV